MRIVTVEGLTSLTQLKDLEYICELANLYLKGSGGQWPERIAHYRSRLAKRIYELEHRNLNSSDNV